MLMIWHAADLDRLARQVFHDAGHIFMQFVLPFADHRKAVLSAKDDMKEEMCMRHFVFGYACFTRLGFWRYGTTGSGLRPAPVAKVIVVCSAHSGKIS